MASRPSVLFVCVHNAGRSQMAAGVLAHLAGDTIEVRSAGSAPADSINPAAVEAMAEVGIDISKQSPKILTSDAVESSDVVITMGCGDGCPVFPGVTYRDWALPDPAGKGLEAVRPIRDEIIGKVDELIAELDPRLVTHRAAVVKKPAVLFVCVKNGGKSQMAAGLMRQIAGEGIAVYSAGTKPATAVNALSAESLREVGVDITGETPTLLDPQLVKDVDVVVTLGREAHVDPVPGTQFENWDTDEPSERGIDGIDRMRLVRDDIAARVRLLAEQLRNPPAQPEETVR